MYKEMCVFCYILEQFSTVTLIDICERFEMFVVELILYSLITYECIIRS